MHLTDTVSAEEPGRQQKTGVPGAGAGVICAAAMLSLVAAMECHVTVMHSDAGASWIPSLIYGAVSWMWWAAAARLLWRAGRRWPAVLRLTGTHAAMQCAIGLLLTVAHLELLRVTVRLLIAGWPVLRDAGYGELRFFEPWRFTLEFLIYGLLWVTCSAVRMRVVAQQDTMHTLELKQQLSAAQLSALQMQVEPHFLLNTLNAITTLVELQRNKEAAETLARLNGMLQSTLERTVPVRVSLARELRMVEDYLAIEQVRFADRLKIEFVIDPAALDGLVPCFLLQPIVENSIRHGVAQREQDGQIEARVERRDGRLHLRIRDNGPGLSGKRQPGHGIGLRNTEDRLRHFYADAYALSLSEPASGGFEVSITIPYEQELR